MLDIAVLKTVVDLFKELLSIVDQRKKRRREIFERVCEPLYQQLQPIAEKYYDIVKKASDGLASKTPNFHSIISEMETQRSALIIARNGILGATAAFKYDSFGPPPEPPAEKIRNEFEELIYRFAESIWNYFYQESQLVRVPKSTRMINLIMSMHGAADVLEAPRIRREEKLNILTKVRQFAQNDLEKLENNWIIVSERYMHLKLYCNK